MSPDKIAQLIRNASNFTQGDFPVFRNISAYIAVTALETEVDLSEVKKVEKSHFERTPLPKGHPKTGGIMSTFLDHRDMLVMAVDASQTDQNRDITKSVSIQQIAKTNLRRDCYYQFHERGESFTRDPHESLIRLIIHGGYLTIPDPLLKALSKDLKDYCSAQIQQSVIDSLQDENIKEHWIEKPEFNSDPSFAIGLLFVLWGKNHEGKNFYN